MSVVAVGANYNKLKINLRLAINRLKMLEAKKTELAQKARKEISDYIADNKYERAKIKVEQIIKDDYLVEAMELIEMYCELLLTRFGIIEQVKALDEGLAEAISSIIWSAPYLQTNIAEIKIIVHLLTVKYGRIYAQAAKENKLNTVNEKLMQKLSLKPPPKILVEKYLIEIAKCHNVNYEPDLKILAEENRLNEPLIDLGNDSNFEKPPSPGFVIDTSSEEKNCTEVQYLQSPISKPFNYPHFNDSSSKNNTPEPRFPSAPPCQRYSASNTPVNKNTIGFIHDSLPPSYESIMNEKPPLYNPNAAYIKSNISAFRPRIKSNCLDDILPELPTVPDTLPEFDDDDDDKKNNNEEIDFNDLTKRFEELKKRK